MDKRLAGIEPEELPPLQILPFGRTAEQEAKLEARKASGKRGLGLCLAFVLSLVFLLVYAAGWAAGHNP